MSGRVSSVSRHEAGAARRWCCSGFDVGGCGCRTSRNTPQVRGTGERHSSACANNFGHAGAVSFAVVAGWRVSLGPGHDAAHPIPETDREQNTMPDFTVALENLIDTHADEIRDGNPGCSEYTYSNVIHLDGYAYTVRVCIDIEPSLYTPHDG